MWSFTGLQYRIIESFRFYVYRNIHIFYVYRILHRFYVYRKYSKIIESKLWSITTLATKHSTESSPSMSSLQGWAQNWTQHSKFGLTSAKYRGSVSALVLLGTLFLIQYFHILVSYKIFLENLTQEKLILKVISHSITEKEAEYLFTLVAFFLRSPVHNGSWNFCDIPIPCEISVISPSI